MYSIFIFTPSQSSSSLRVLPSPCSGLPPQFCLGRSGGQDGGCDRERRAETGVVDHRAARSGEDRLMQNLEFVPRSLDLSFVRM